MAGFATITSQFPLRRHNHHSHSSFISQFPKPQSANPLKTTVLSHSQPINQSINQSIMSYQDRARDFGFATKDQLKQVLDDQEHRAVVLDVRSQDEIRVSGKFEYGNNTKWVQAACMPNDATELESSSEFLLPDKDAPVVVYCKSGRRASTAKQALEAQGYTNVLNAGGYDDVVSMGIAAQ
jgi:rhodanese-related sulfurtransferase